MGFPQSMPFELLRCTHCGDVIGVYEPLIVKVGDEVRETSRAADAEVPVQAAEHYHRDCFTALKHAGKS